MVITNINGEGGKTVITNGDDPNADIGGLSMTDQKNWAWDAMPKCARARKAYVDRPKIELKQTIHAKPQRRWILLLVLLMLLGLAILTLPSLSTRVNTTTQSRSQGQCLSNGQGFDDQQEAFRLAQVAEQYRAVNKFGGNYGLGSYTLCYKDGTQEGFQSTVFKGYWNTDQPDLPRNAFHSEQSAHGWLKNQFRQLRLNQSVVAIYAVIFSQVEVCPLCKNNMISWQRDLREVAPVKQVFLAIWDIPKARGFIPAKYPYGTGTPVAIDDLEKVAIPFAP